MAEKMSVAEFKKATARTTGGKKARDNGSAAENLILSHCEAYLVQGRAKLEKVDPPTKVVNFGGKPKVIYQKNPFLDLVGTWTEKQGRALFLEVKSTTSKRLPISRDNGLTKVQIKHLREWRDAGAITALLWVHDGALKVISTETIDFAESCGNPSIPWSDFPLCRAGNSPFLRFDFLAEISDE
jgi:penicillin-binding protein-related factor A (putative recombinase)